MQVRVLTNAEWSVRAHDLPGVMSQIDDGDVLIVRTYLSESEAEAFRAYCLAFGAAQAPSWHPCLEGCPDYHRIHDRYPDAYVPSVQRGYYFHPWNRNFTSLAHFDAISRLFDLKLRLGGAAIGNPLLNTPADGVIARILSHQYPRGGGGQAEHVDPVSPFATIQTILQLSQPGVDFTTGGLYVNDPNLGVVPIDERTQKGDLILLSPGVRHGVAPIDPDQPLDWNRTDGRWVAIPVIIHSDHVKESGVRPQALGKL